MTAYWHWPQWVMATLYTISLLSGPLLIGKPKKPKTEAEAVIGMAFTTLIILILHAGGFW